MFFSSDSPENAGIVDNLSNKRYQSVINTLNKYNSYYIDNISNLKGMYLIRVDGDSGEFWYYNGNNYNSPKEWDKAIYDTLVKIAEENPEEDVLYAKIGDIIIEIDKQDLNQYKHYITNMVKDSETTFLVNFTPSGTKYIARYNSPYIYDYDDFADSFSLDEDEYVSE